MMACWQYQEKLRPLFGEIILNLQDYGLLRDTFAQNCFFLNEQLNASAAPADMSSKELETVSILDQNAKNNENLYTSMSNNKPEGASNGGNSTGGSVEVPIVTGPSSSPKDRNGSLTGNGSIPHGVGVGKCTEC